MEDARIRAALDARWVVDTLNMLAELREDNQTLAARPQKCTR
jgi:hypothetical protein